MSLQLINACLVNDSQIIEGIRKDLANLDTTVNENLDSIKSSVGEQVNRLTKELSCLRKLTRTETKVNTNQTIELTAECKVLRETFDSQSKKVVELMAECECADIG